MAVLAGLLLALAMPAVAAEGPPVAVALVLDTSGSIRPRELAWTRELAVAVLGGLPPNSEFAVFSFDDQSRLLLPLTSNVDEVRRAVDGLRTSGHHTALHDALYDASRYLRDVGGGRRVILLLTDGRDEQSALDLEDGLAVAQQTRIPVLCVGVGRSLEERVLRRIAKLTGGAYLRAGEATGAAVVSRILAAMPPSVIESPSPPSPPPPAPAPSATTTTRPRGMGLALAGGLGLLVLLTGAAVTLLLLRRRAAPRPGTGPKLEPRDFSSTVLSKMDLAEEEVERTVLIRRRGVVEVTRGPGAGRVFELSQQSATSIGRSRANDITLDDVAISGQHCRIRPEGGDFVLHDLDSTNGTLVNNRRVSRHTLAAGDVIKIGDTALEFRLEKQRG